MAARGATTAGAGIALRAARRINQKAASACAIFHREPRHVGFRTFFLSAAGVTNAAAVVVPKASWREIFSRKALTGKKKN
ncbi:MAG: hypothetical protein DMG54_28695 [Acidobacteria bacterium]|nr:MAG: hypothetical protein DMG54_28695 [Acidobacteriota bacterium]